VKPSATLAMQLADAARVVARVAAGASLADEMARVREPRAALIDLTHGCLRRYGRVQAIVAALARRNQPDAPVEALLWCCLYAFDSARHAEHTVVNEAVKAAGLLERWSAKGFVNAVLRSYLRERPAIEARLKQDEPASYQHPQWWIDRVREAYPADWQAALASGNTHPPMCLRVNRRRIDAAAYARRLEEAGMRAQHLGAEAFVLEKPVPVENLPGFAAGEVSVQDLGAQRAARCLDLRDGQRVLDACAAPGGKTTHLLERAELEVTALDIDASRAGRIASSLERLGLRADIRVGDAARPRDWWDGNAFERILVDAPCSASGIARRRPDVKWLRRAQDLPAFAEKQLSLLRALWPLLGAGGKLLYVTCSVFPQENDAVVDAFLAAEAQARRVALPDGGEGQWLPAAQHDGFYYALIAKAA
jgi:16S rRNA (cytosine967-C5)-methyltransferase